MAADVSSGQKEEREGKRDLVTRDLLGGSGGAEVNLEVEVPAGWDRKLDLLSGKTCLEKRDANPVLRQLHDLNLPPPSTTYESVCTLEKVKSALERAAGESSQSNSQRRGTSDGSPSSSSMSPSIKRRASEEVAMNGQDSAMSGGMMMVTGCPSCLQYLLISKLEPRCPRCDSHVPVPAFMKMKKKVRIDLNSEFSPDYYY